MSFEIDISNMLASLNERQHEVVVSDDANSLVIAGAGSGKTHVLISRIAYLIASRAVQPAAILAVTFTNKAAAEMCGRLSQHLNDGARILAGTFHSIANRMLRMDYERAGLPRDFQILDNAEQLALIKRFCKERSLDKERFPPTKVQWQINRFKDQAQRAADVNERLFNDERLSSMLSRVVAPLYQQYEAYLDESGAVDFAELLLRSYELLRNDQEVKQRWQRRLSHLLIDEFQDTNYLQYIWLKELALPSANVMAVGDDDQSIYGWRGARIENIDSFSQDFAPVKVFRLEQNYRSTTVILNAANALIANNSRRMGKQLWSDQEGGHHIKKFEAIDEHHEANFVVSRFAAWRESGEPLNDIAALYRTNAQSRVIEEACVRHGIPYRIYGGQRFYDRMEIKDALAYMRLLVNPDSDVAFERVINRPQRGIGESTIAMLRAAAQAHQLSLWEAIPKVENSRAVSVLGTFVALIDRLRQRALAAERLDETARLVVESSGLRDWHGKGKFSEARLENLDELITACADYEEEQSPEFSDDAEQSTETPPAIINSIGRFLAAVALDAGDAAGADSKQDAAQLMTLHASKGLEFASVLIVGLEDGLFPGNRSIDEPNLLEEERRLFFVGMTRARRQLYLSHARSRRLFGYEFSDKVPSRFIAELPKKLLQNFSYANDRATAFETRFSDEEHDADQAFGFQIGDSVRHEKFGIGVIRKFAGEGGQTRVRVQFGQSNKWLMMQYARLQRHNEQ